MSARRSPPHPAALDAPADGAGPVPSRRARHWWRAWGSVGAGYLLFLGAFGWHAYGAVRVHAGPALAADWPRGMLRIGALLLVARGVRAARTALGAGSEFRLRAAGPVLPAAAEPAAMFIGRLYGLGPAGWALAAATAHEHAGPRAAARAILCAVLADLRLEGAEPRLAQAVAAVLLRPTAAPLAAGVRGAGHRAALSAALAVLVRPSLPARDFEVLYAPFAQVIPAHSLWPPAERSAQPCPPE